MKRTAFIALALVAVVAAASHEVQDADEALLGTALHSRVGTAPTAADLDFAESVASEDAFGRRRRRRRRRFSDSRRRWLARRRFSDSRRRRFSDARRRATRSPTPAPTPSYGGTCRNGNLIALRSRTQHNHCGSCDSGYYLTNKRCAQQPTCGAGKYYYARSTALRSCYTCPTNTYQASSSHRSYRCSDQPFCGAGQKISADSKIARRTCGSCRAYWYQTSRSHRETACPNEQPICGAGQKFSSSIADSRTAKRTCSACPANEYQLSKKHRYTACKAKCVAGNDLGLGDVQGSLQTIQSLVGD